MNISGWAVCGYSILILCIVPLLCYLIFGRNTKIDNCGKSNNDNENNVSAIEILKVRYAKGEINKEEFDRIKRDIS